MPNSIVCLSFDFDAMSVWLAYDRVTPAMLDRGEYGARVGVPRVLELLERARAEGDVLRPGPHGRIVSGRDRCRSSMPGTRSRTTPTRTSTRADRARTRSARTWSAPSLCSKRIGVKPQGFRSPSADLSAITLELVEEHGFLYDSSLMTDDYRPFRPRIGDKVARGEPLERGREAKSLGAADVLRARRLGALPVQLRPVPEGRRAAESTCSRSGVRSSTSWTRTPTAGC